MYYPYNFNIKSENKITDIPFPEDNFFYINSSQITPFNLQNQFNSHIYTPVDTQIEQKVDFENQLDIYNNNRNIQIQNKILSNNFNMNDMPKPTMQIEKVEKMEHKKKEDNRVIYILIFILFIFILCVGN